VRVVLGDALNKFGFDHRDIGSGGVRMTISVKMPRTVKSLNALRVPLKLVTKAK
jgi:hypothetical protein